MNKIVYLIAIFVFTAGNAQAFDFHGVKSGMSKEQVANAMSTIGAKKAGYPDNKWENLQSIGFPPHAVLTNSKSTNWRNWWKNGPRKRR